jgi:hypothetical protein
MPVRSKQGPIVVIWNPYILHAKLINVCMPKWPFKTEHGKINKVSLAIIYKIILKAHHDICTLKKNKRQHDFGKKI